MKKNHSRSHFGKKDLSEDLIKIVISAKNFIEKEGKK
jgi:hypothetical protein